MYELLSGEPMNELFPIINGSLIAPDEFIEFLHDSGYEHTIEIDELADVIRDWAEDWEKIAVSDLIVLCFNCGGTFTVPQGTANPTRQCPKCRNNKWNTSSPL